MFHLRSVLFKGSSLSLARNLTASLATAPKRLNNQTSTINTQLVTTRINLFSTATISSQNNSYGILSSAKLLLPNLALRAPSSQPCRTVTKWSLQKGKRKAVKAVVKRFYRLAWGAWIRPMVGRDKRHWRKTAKRKIRGEKHVFCNATQSTLLDKMVTKYWRRRKYYVDDIYEPYHTREEFPQSAVKPR
uniref:Large ribosomal subunit protein bL35m n=1 Tax=Moina brachiata TaxID=675436 RepID=A0A4Y7NLC4_9CRUS|nr:EOG090X0J5E [Moina brachiata]SVE93377.1 EOG090X0J5E [Moina brachiata]